MRRAKLTVSAQQCLFIASIINRLSFVIAKWIYIDTLQVTFGEPLSNRERCRLTRLNGGAVEPQPTQPERFVCVEILHQPTPEAINYLSSIRPLHYINRLDIALDLDFASWESLWEHQDAIRQAIYMKWHAQREVTGVYETTYFGKPWERRNPTIYSDLPSKISGKPTIHIEVRLFGVAVCDRYGARTLDEIAELDREGIILRNLGLAFVETNRFRKNLKTAADRKTPAHLRRVIGQYQARRSWERSLQQSLGREMVGGSYRASRPLLAQLKVQDCMDAKLAIFSRAIVRVPFDLVIDGAQRA